MKADVYNIMRDEMFITVDAWRQYCGDDAVVSRGLNEILQMMSEGKWYGGRRVVGIAGKEHMCRMVEADTEEDLAAYKEGYSRGMEHVGFPIDSRVPERLTAHARPYQTGYMHGYDDGTKNKISENDNE